MKKYSHIIILLIIQGCSIQYTERLTEKGSSNAEGIGNYHKAMRVYNRAIFLNKKSALAYWRRGNLYSSKVFHYNYTKAISDLSKSIQIDSTFDSGYAFWDRAYCKRNIGDSIGALLDYNKAIAISPRQQNFYYYRATLKYYRLHDTIGALNDLDSAIKLWNEYDLARQCRAELRVKMHDYKGAKEDYDKLLYPLRGSDTDDADIFYFRGISKYETGDKNGACGDWAIAKNLGYKIAQEKIMQFCK